MPKSTAYAIVRPLPHSFLEALHQHPPREPIDLAKAKIQHEHYTKLLENQVTHLVTLPVDESHPDSCFVEDTAFFFGMNAVISRIGAPSRRQESEAVYEKIQEIQKNLKELKIHRLLEPATLDGGDVLVMAQHIFVGISHRTNQAAVDQLLRLFPGKVTPIVVGSGLHLKSVLSHVDDETLVVWDHPAALAMAKAMAEALAKSLGKSLSGKNLKVVKVPDAVAANVVSLGDLLMVQKGYPKSQEILQSMAHNLCLRLVPLDMSELVKADGALTCCSLILKDVIF